MGRVVSITLSEYRAIMQWEEDGGSNADITYEIVPDLPDCDEKTSESDEPAVPISLVAD
jgi:hypothetical protein